MARGLIALLLVLAFSVAAVAAGPELWVTVTGEVVEASPNVPAERIVVVNERCTGTVVTQDHVLTASHCVSPLGGTNRVRIGSWEQEALNVWDSAVSYEPKSRADRGLDLAVLRLTRRWRYPVPPSCARRPYTGEIGYSYSFSAGREWWRAQARSLGVVVDANLGRVAVWAAYVFPGSSGSFVWSSNGCVLGMVTHGILGERTVLGADGERLLSVVEQIWSVLR